MANVNQAGTTMRIGFTEAHGMADEFSKFPPEGVSYSFLDPLKPRHVKLVRSQIKGYLRRFESDQHDIIEAVLSPILTHNRWVYSIANCQEATSFNVLGLPVPRTLRVAYIKSLLTRDNLKKVIFWSDAGRRTLQSYGGVTDRRLLDKVTVVYPAIRRVADELIKFNDGEVEILFSGDFFRKGGANVVDAFEQAQQRFPSIRLRLCCDPKIDFNTPNEALRTEYLQRIGDNPAITLGRVSRDKMINEVLPRTDIYALPTYVEAFGFALLEAMAFGIPVISTNHFAIPEIVEDGVSGFLIDTSGFPCETLFRGYVVDQIPEDFRQKVTEGVYKGLCSLIESKVLREKMGRAGCDIARSKFSIETRNARMLEIYRAAMVD